MKKIIDIIDTFGEAQWEEFIGGEFGKTIPSKSQPSSVAAIINWAATESKAPILMLGQEVHIWNGKFYDKGRTYDVIEKACEVLKIPKVSAIDPDFTKNVEKCLTMAIDRYSLDLNFNPRGINFQDGFLEMTQTEANFHQGHNTNNVFTYCLPFAYNGGRKESKVWSKFIEQIVPDKGMRDYVLASFANAVACDPMKAQRMMLLMGVGASGKSTLIDALVEVIGKKNACRVDDLRNLTKDESRFRIDLASNILCICGDASGDIGNKDVLKQIVSKEEIAGRRLYREVEYFTPRASLLVASNEIGFTHALGDSGISRRIDIIQFNNPVAEKDRDPFIGEKLAAPNEQREMVLDMIGALIAIQNEFGKMVRPQELDNALNDLRYDGDAFLSFLGNSGLEVSRAEDVDEVEWIHQDRLYRAFVMHSSESGTRSASMRHMKGKCAAFGIEKDNAGQRKHKFKFTVVDREAYDKAMLVLTLNNQSR